MDDPETPGPEEGSDVEKLRQIEEELAKIAGSTKFAEPDEPGHESKLREIEERARAARNKQAAQITDMRMDHETTRGMGVGLSAAYGIIGLPLVGAGLGWLADRMFHTGFCVIAGVVLGLVGGMVYAVQISNRQ